jgi:hypothetical protein
VKIVAGRHVSEHERKFVRDEGSTLAEHRAPRVAAVHGKRAKRYAKREHLLGLGEEALAYITELVHRRPKVWYRDVDELHDLLEVHGDVPLRLAFVRGLAERVFGHEYIAHYLAKPNATRLSEFPDHDDHLAASPTCQRWARDQVIGERLVELRRGGVGPRNLSTGKADRCRSVTR